MWVELGLKIENMLPAVLNSSMSNLGNPASPNDGIPENPPNPLPIALLDDELKKL